MYSYGDKALPKQFEGFRNENAIVVGDENDNVVAHPFGFIRGKDITAKIQSQTKVEGMKPTTIVNVPNMLQFPK